mmetsp:Transcript_26495/g.63970  ORF Transcript_26495/g.63970 Transcript_26495/m.63970 type:complete len:130 (-) Transcript_26495:419-808(-)
MCAAAWKALGGCMTSETFTLGDGTHAMHPGSRAAARTAVLMHENAIKYAGRRTVVRPSSRETLWSSGSFGGSTQMLSPPLMGFPTDLPPKSCEDDDDPHTLAQVDRVREDENRQNHREELADRLYCCKD